MAGLLDLLQGSGGGWLGPYLNAGKGSFPVTPAERDANLQMQISGLLGGGAVPPMKIPPSPFDNAVPYSPQKMPMSVADTAPQGDPTIASALPPPINVGAMPVAEVDSAAIPPAAHPAQYQQPQAPQSAPQTAPQGAQLPSFLGGGGNFLDGLKNSIAGGLSIMNPQAGQAYMQQQIMRAALPQLLQQTGGDLPKAMAMLQNQKLQEQIYGNATSLGSIKAGNVEFPAYAQGGRVGYAVPGGQGGLGNLIQMGNEAARSNAAAEAAGKVQGTNAANLPQTTGTMDLALKNIDDVLKDPSLPNVIGTIAGRLPPVGGKQADLVNKISQLQSQTMLQGFQQLRGAGRITQAEMFKAGEALARLNRVGSVDGFKSALQDLRDVVAQARTRAGVMAGGEPTPPPAQQSAATPSFSQDQLRAEAIRRGLIK